MTRKEVSKRARPSGVCPVYPRPRLWQRMRLVAVVLLVACSCAGDGTGPAVEDAARGLEAFDSLMTTFMQSNGIEAGALGIMRHGEVVYENGFGFMDRGHQTQVPGTVLMRLASVTKPVTAAVVQELAAEGLLSLDDRAFDLGQDGGGILDLTPFPELGDERLATITLRHLLQHRGGWDRDVAGDPTYRERQIAAGMGVPSPPGRQRTVRHILGQPLQFTPGSDRAYSNIGYLVLGLVVERVTGQPFMEVVHERVFGPLGVPASEIIRGRTFPEDRDPREPFYDSDATGPSVFSPTGANVPMTEGGWDHEARVAQGGLVASTRAMLEFLEVFQVAGDGIGTRRSGSEGRGWRWNHTGSLWGTNTLARQRGDGVSYVVLLNRRPSSGSSYASRLRTELDGLLDLDAIDWR